MNPALDDRTETSRDYRPGARDDFEKLQSPKREVLGLQRAAWNDGRPLRPEDLLERWPTDATSDPDTASVLLEDYLQRRGRGDDASVEEYERRFPGQQRPFQRALGEQTASYSGSAPSDRSGFLLRLPDVGDTVFGFRLSQRLGQGAFARVFLAEQADLAGRPVVLKVSNIEGDEPQTLAQLLHTNIVPIYSLHDDASAGLRAVCMPYVGGASLSQVLERLWKDSSRPTRGEQFIQALEAVETAKPDSLGHNRKDGSQSGAGDGPPRASERPAEMGDTGAVWLRAHSYEHAAAWIVARLADGLHHAHQRGIVHRDIKPSNILISGDAEPLLLDFNLALVQRDDIAHPRIGGTIAYMGPEHLRALLDQTPALVRQVDHRSDIYSLGMVLAEMLAGHRPFAHSGSYSVSRPQIEAMALERSKTAPSLKRDRPDISWGMESIVRKCLAPDPKQRYQSALELADDLRRLIEDRPLRHAPELSRREQVRKFIRRHPRLSSSSTVAAVAVVVLLALGTVFAGVRNQLAETRLREKVRAHDAGVQQALCLINTRLDYQDHLREGIAACERTLALFDAQEGRAWNQDAGWLRIAPEDRRRLAEDRRELFMLLAGARVRLAGESAPAARDALELLEKAEAIPGLPPSRALWLDRARYLALCGETERARSASQHALEIPAATARDHYLLALSLVRQGEPGAAKSAINELDLGLRKNPRHYWSLLQRGICRLERGELVEASADFSQCIGIWPEFAWGYFNRGCVFEHAGDTAAALADFTAALQRDGRLTPAYVNRGLARLALKQYVEALADFDRAGALGAKDPSIAAGRGMALEGLGRHREADQAFADCFARSAGLPDSIRARLAWSYGFAISARDPDRAGAAFDDALRLDSRSAQALYGRAMLAMNRGSNAEAIRDFEHALEADPARIEARRYLAVALARLGSWERATQEINRCLEREPHSAPTLYAAACVVARFFDKSPSRATSNQALDLLKRALSEGADPAKAACDQDLASIRRLPRFQQLIGQDHGAEHSSSTRPL